MNEQPHSATFARRGVFDHLHVGVGIAKGKDRAAADMRVDADRLADLIVDELTFYNKLFLENVLLTLADSDDIAPVLLRVYQLRERHL